jgi:putative acetyltransferase
MAMRWRWPPDSVTPRSPTGVSNFCGSAAMKSAEVMVAETDCVMVGFVTVDPRTFCLDQIVVALDHWRSAVGGALTAKAKRVSPAGLDLDVNIDDAGAIGFYCRLGFLITGAGQNPISGKPVHRMSWRP